MPFALALPPGGRRRRMHGPSAGRPSVQRRVRRTLPSRFVLKHSSTAPKANIAGLPKTVKP